MALFADSNTLYQNIKAALPDWSFAENPSISDAVLGTIPSGKFSLWTTPSGEELVVSLRQTSLTGSDRVKPQIRVFTDNAQLAYLYAKHKNLRYFFFAYCVTPPASLKFSAGIEPSEYLVSIESKILPTTPGRLDIRSMYDNMFAPETRPFFRIPPAEHSCPSLTQSCFIRICDSSGSFTTSQLENYLQYFDSRPYMTDLSGGYRVVFNPSALYNPDPSPLDLPHNLLVHGAPGTGKSHFLNKAATDLATAGQAIYRRVTFYEDYSYGQFVGEYMPVPQEDCTETVALEYAGTPVSGTVSGEHITYRFSPGPLAELLADCYAAKLNKSPMKSVEMRNETGTHELSTMQNPLVDKLFAYLLQDVFRNTPSSFFAENIHTLSQLRQALKNLAFNGTSVDIKSLTVLPEKSYITPSV